jgi:hypothetical protein
MYSLCFSLLQYSQKKFLSYFDKTTRTARNVFLMISDFDVDHIRCFGTSFIVHFAFRWKFRVLCKTYTLWNKSNKNGRVIITKNGCVTLQEFYARRTMPQGIGANFCFAQKSPFTIRKGYIPITKWNVVFKF